MWGKGSLSPSWWEYLLQPLWETVWSCLEKQKLGYLPTQHFHPTTEQCSFQRTYAHHYPSQQSAWQRGYEINPGIQQQASGYDATGNYAATKGESTQCATTWIDLKYVKLDKLTQKKRSKCRGTLSCICSIQKNRTWKMRHPRNSYVILEPGPWMSR